MSPMQGKPGLFFVIKAPETPPVGVVTERAFRPQPQVVDILLAMAVDATHLGIPETRREVALLARHHGMKTQQRKLRQVVFEEDIGGPALLGVTSIAIRTFLALVDVIPGVAFMASGSDLFFSQRSRVAPLTLHGRVGPAQRELRHALMIESLRLPAGLAVTAVTTVPIASPVHIVRAVTRHTVH